ncbi:MAG TPA: hypothetical protein VLH81_00140, partial [Desulfobacterales bacterium]|nr:hypothetical protein [Desulfobacterales bacterium]
NPRITGSNFSPIFVSFEEITLTGICVRLGRFRWICEKFFKWLCPKLQLQGGRASRCEAYWKYAAATAT